MGAALCTQLIDTRPEAAGLLLLHGLGDPPAAARRGLPVQVHLAEPDPFVAGPDIAAWIPRPLPPASRLESFRYPGAGHLFTDAAIPDDHDDAAAALLWRRAVAFLDGL